MKKVLVACERSQIVTEAFLKCGCDAYSCDIEDCLGVFPERHIKEDCRKVLLNEEFDIVIGHPPCTYLSNAGHRHFGNKNYWNIDRYHKMIEARELFMFFYNLPGRVCIENPMLMKVCNLPKEDLVIHPWMFGDDFNKKTYLWLHHLPPLWPVYQYSLTKKSYVLNHKGFERSRFWPGIAKAMAEQWSVL